MIDEAKLLGLAKEAAARAYAPYSEFRVGAAIQTADGGIYTGVNIENASFGLTLCAERAALAAAVTDGQREFASIAVAALDRRPVWPCGACLQVLSEFGSDILIITEDKSGQPVSRDLKELLPESFDFKKE